VKFSAISNDFKVTANIFETDGDIQDRQTTSLTEITLTFGEKVW